MPVIRFKIGDAFPADDPVARFITGLGMISNDWLRLITDMLSSYEDESPEGRGRRVSLFRRQAALVHEAANFIADAARMFPAVATFVDGLDGAARDCCERVIGSVDSASSYYLGKWLTDLRNVTNHYPRMPPDAAQRGEESMANALDAAGGIEGTIDSGERFVDARFGYADEIGVQLVPPLDDASWMEELRDTAMALAEFAQRAAQKYLEARPTGTFTIDQGSSR